MSQSICPDPTQRASKSHIHFSQRKVLCCLKTCAVESELLGFGLNWTSEVPVVDAIDVAIVTADPSICHLIQLAKRKLYSPHGTFELKIAAYLKFCCLAIQKSYEIGQLAPPPNLYFNLMQWLGECDPEWWQQCLITVDRGIISNNACIQDLLRPIENFVNLFAEVGERAH
jgi:hypothetical protein